MDRSGHHLEESVNTSFGVFSLKGTSLWSMTEKEKQSFAERDIDLDIEASKDNSKADGVGERYSTKIFVGGIPLGTTDVFLRQCFGAFDMCDVSWPGKKNYSDTPPNGYCFIQFRHHEAVRALLNACTFREDKHFFPLGRRNDLVQIRPWRISDSTYTVSELWTRFVRLSVFVGGLPRTLKAFELFELVQQRFGNVLHCSVELEFESSYPKGAARVIFGSVESYRAAAAAGHVEHQWHPNRHYNPRGNFQAEFKPFIYKNISCENCGNIGRKTDFCTANECLLYYCRPCFDKVHRNNPLFVGHKCSEATPRDLPNPCVASKSDGETSGNSSMVSNLPQEATSSMKKTESDDSLKENGTSGKAKVEKNVEKRPRKFGGILTSYGVDI
ncbi:unnamed protein product [Bursaphelenchus xylophilus]|uniref:(pine wood nematode) hypothetical protein n=1 Tax=Bursaphelenchus xylophilus TaxID=6326 RepID=A0A1I7RWN0_BURXY|nr:unnamed protein product [Bursaphelenchus xylophilus]CAG9128503.1 unnamed protein product [Bursaphelenchus xylophilus]